MEPDKFETYIKSKLDTREIKPSDATWQKISRELKSEQSVKKPTYFWLGIAASVVVVVGVAIFFRANQEKIIPVSPVIVHKPVTVPVNGEEPNLIETDKIMNGLALENDIAEVADVEKNGITAYAKNSTEGTFKQGQEEIVVADMHKKESIPIEIRSELSDAVLNKKIAEVAAQVALLEESSQVTDAEVDSLLRNAQHMILKEQLLKPDQSVDAMALLTEVEGQLDQSFRDQIFQSLKTGFLKVRTAVADRNN